MPERRQDIVVLVQTCVDFLLVLEKQSYMSAKKETPSARANSLVSTWKGL